MVWEANNIRANCLNWVLGHLANNRDRMLNAFGEPPQLSEAETQCYTNSSDPLLENGENVLKLEELVSKLEHAQERIAVYLASATEEDLARQVSHGDRTVPLAQRLFFLYFHETYHGGQTELLRQATGVNDHVI